VRCEQGKIAVVVSNLVGYLRTSDGVVGSNYQLEDGTEDRCKTLGEAPTLCKIKNRKG
jgi:hypothetical protein